MNYKKIFTVASTICLLFIISYSIAQKKGKENSKDVAYKFLDAVEKLKFIEAKTYATNETDKMLDMLESFSSMMPDSVKYNPQKVTIISTIEDKKSSEVTYTLSKNPSEKKILKLEFIDNKWEAIMTKDEE